MSDKSLLPLPDHRASRACSAFTLIEVLLVIVLLGIISSSVILGFQDMSGDVKESAVTMTVKAVKDEIMLYRVQNDAYPATVTPLFMAGNRPINPYAGNSGVISVYSGTDVTLTEPASKTVGTAAFWYNPHNGSFRALIEAQDNSAATLALYNRVNNTQLTSLSDTQ